MNDDNIKFYYESDGDPNHKTHYIIARHPEWHNEKRLDCDQHTSDLQNKNQARKLALALQHGNISMQKAAEQARGKWL